MVSEPHRSEPDLVVLHTLRCVGVTDEERLARASGRSVDETIDHLNRLSARDWVELAPGPFGGWSLTHAGRVAGQEMLDAELELTQSRDGIQDCYETFLRLNPTLLQICSEWQMKTIGTTPVLNDHTDADYDARVLSRLMRIDQSAQEVIADLASRLTRFKIYGGRLSNALDGAIAGDATYVADGLDSYHTVWFQLHEDLLTTLGISRDDERRDASG